MAFQGSIELGNRRRPNDYDDDNDIERVGLLGNGNGHHQDPHNRWAPHSAPSQFRDSHQQQNNHYQGGRADVYSSRRSQQQQTRNGGGPYRNGRANHQNNNGASSRYPYRNNATHNYHDDSSDDSSAEQWSDEDTGHYPSTISIMNDDPYYQPPEAEHVGLLTLEDNPKSRSLRRRSPSHKKSRSRRRDRLNKKSFSTRRILKEQYYQQRKNKKKTWSFFLLQELSSWDQWSCSRLMRYLTLTAVSAMATFWLLHRSPQTAVHWDNEELLLPHVAPHERCHIRDEPCNCPDPSKAVHKLTDLDWRIEHEMLIEEAKKAPADLDVVFFGDDFFRQWSGSDSRRAIKEIFDEHFVKKQGAKIDGVALGSTGDLGPNMLYHLQHGLLDALNPRVWVIMTGANDMYDANCADALVEANILNVVKTIYESKTTAEIIVHGILPRKEQPDSDSSQFLGKRWSRAQTINTKVRQFVRSGPRIHYLNGGFKLLEETDKKGRKQVDPKLMEDGIHPTAAGLVEWTDYVLPIVENCSDETEKTCMGKNKLSYLLDPDREDIP